MPKLMQKCGFIQAGTACGYMEYIATRENVEIVYEDGPVTKGQRQLIKQLLSDFPDSKKLFEYEDYCSTPNFRSASTFISMALDSNLHNINSEDGYMKYIATRPRVEKHGEHGLFSSTPSVDLNAALSELNSHEGNVWTIIYSLRRSDATQLGYDNADAWRSLLMRHQHDLAKAIKIPNEQFRWYAAYHDEGTHPHVHVMLWSNDRKSGFLTKEGVSMMRSKLTNAIFQEDMKQIYMQKDIAYKELSQASKETMQQLIQRMEHRLCDNPVIEQNMMQLVQKLETTSGKKQYGYLSKSTKELVDRIVDELAKQPEVASCYDEWNRIRDELESYYNETRVREHQPLSQQKEFRAIKNMVIREAENIRLGTFTFEDHAIQDELEPQPLPKPEQDIPTSTSHEHHEHEHKSQSIYEQVARYHAAKAVLQDINSVLNQKLAAIAELKQLWDEGLTVAAHQLGKTYRDELTVLRDHKEAELWFRRSAEAGNDYSEYALGKLLLSQHRYEEAIHWLSKAANQENPFAQYRLGKLHLTGEGVTKSVDTAIEYLTQSANQGNQFAQYSLGKLFLLGKDVKQDKEAAKEWLSRSAAQGNEYAKFFLERMNQFLEPSVLLSATNLLRHMARIFRDNSIPPQNPKGIQMDSLRRRKLMDKRLAMGHKADDHEEQIQYQPTMSM